MDLILAQKQTVILRILYTDWLIYIKKKIIF